MQAWILLCFGVITVFMVPKAHAESDFGIGRLLPGKYVESVRKGSEDSLPTSPAGDVYQSSTRVSRPINPFFQAQAQGVVKVQPQVAPPPVPLKVPVFQPAPVKIVSGPDPFAMKPAVEPTHKEKISNRLLAGAIDPAPQAALPVEVPKAPPQSDTIRALNTVLAYHEKYDVMAAAQDKKRPYWSNPDPSVALKSTLDNTDSQHIKSAELGEAGTSIRAGNADSKNKDLYQQQSKSTSLGMGGNSFGSGFGSNAMSLPFSLPQLPMTPSSVNSSTQN